jgi:3-phosphoshikimate 1-carboxyvinyltransferase
MSQPEGAGPVSVAASGPLDAAIRVPPSKSLTQRALAAAAMARGTSLIRGPLAAEDTQFLARALRTLGVPVGEEADGWRVEGSPGPFPAAEADLQLGNAGTAMRFLTPILATGRGRYTLDGSPRMRQRPMGDLLSALSGLGAKVRSAEGNGCPPVVVEADGLPGGEVAVRGTVSSQFISGLLLAAPRAQGDLALRIDGSLVSRPYVEMTLDVMRRFGATVDREALLAERAEKGRCDEGAGVIYRARAGGYVAAEYEVEGDASSACWWFAAAAVTGGRARVRGIPPSSKQGDLGFLGILESMGCRVRRGADTGGAFIEVTGGPLKGVEANLADMPDTAPALGAVALFASSPTRITGAAHLRAKESDRIAGLAGGLGALGARTEEHRDGLTIRPGSLREATLDPLDDHRLAMAFAVAGLGIGGIRILNPTCVGKSYPGFFEELRRHSAPRSG